MAQEEDPRPTQVALLAFDHVCSQTPQIKSDSVKDDSDGSWRLTVPNTCFRELTNHVY